MTTDNVTSSETTAVDDTANLQLADVAFALDLTASVDPRRVGAIDGAEVLNIYTLALEDIVAAATERKATATLELCRQLTGQLEDVRLQGRTPTEQEITFLARWPEQLVAYLTSPASHTSCDELLSYLQDSHWPKPLSNERADALRGQLCGVNSAASAPSTAAARIHSATMSAETTTTHDHSSQAAALTDELSAAQKQNISESVLQQLKELLNDSRKEMENLLTASIAPEISAADRAETLEYYAVQLEIVGMEAANCGLSALNDFLKALQHRVTELLLIGLSPQQHYTLDLLPNALNAYLSAPTDPSTAEGLLDLLRGDIWATSLAPDHESTLLSGLTMVDLCDAEHGSAYQTSTAPTGNAHNEAALETSSLTDEPITAQQQVVGESMLKLLSHELDEIVEDIEKCLQTAAAQGQPAAAQTESIDEYAQQIERLGMAAETIGLTALNSYLSLLRRRIIDNKTAGLSPRAHAACALLPNSLHAYLLAPTDPSTAEGLIDLLRGDIWSVTLEAGYAATLARALSMVVVSSDAEMIEQRQTEAHAEDVVLTIPNDMNRELLEGLLLELPQHTSDFSTAIQNIASGVGSLADIDVAKRAAHTLKGAANTVGIKGIANLTHHVEDILVALSRHEKLPNHNLSEVLTRAGDCLEAMGEAVMGTGPEPDDSLAVLQEILDWANRIDHEGIPEDDDAVNRPQATRAVSSEDQLSGATTENTSSPLQNESMVRVPAALIDELLRLMGETIISTGQVRERSRRLVERNKSVQQQNSVFLQLATELEDLVELRGSAGDLSMARKDDEFDPLEFEHYSELHTISRRLIEAATDSGALSSDVHSELSELNELIEVQNRLHALSQNVVMRTRMVPVFTVISRLQRSVRQTSRLLDKRVSLNVTGADTMIDSNILNELIDPLMHILRNAVDHGIETPDMRQRAGKSAEGRIELAFLREGTHVVVRCRDDGAGLDLAAVQRTAEEKGLLNTGKTLTDDELARLVLAPGFSTRSESTQVSGRGIGMDVVHSKVLQLKGGLNLHSKPGEGMEIEMRLPATLIATHALIVREHGRIFAISNYGIQDIHYVDSKDLQHLSGESFFRLGETIYPLAQLDNLLHISSDRRTRDREAGFPVLLVRLESGTIHAVRVQDIVDSRELVVKGLGRYVPKPQGVVGATILGDGSVAAVIDIPELMRTPVTMTSGLEAQDAGHGRSESRGTNIHMTALVVDDSLSARRATAQFMKDAGFEVRTAIDGLEAVSILDKWKPDILLVDMEMPRMNGLELTAHVRAREGTANIPVIMITSRSTEKHRSQAASAGVNVYLTKPFGDEELLQHITKLTAA